MTTNPKAARYHTRRVERPAPADPAAGSGLLFDNDEDGFGSLDFRRPEDQAAASRSGAQQPASADAGEEPADPAARVAMARSPEEIAEANAAIAAEGLTARQLRRAALVAQRNRLNPTSEHDAVRLLREAGVDPFSRASLLRIVSPAAEPFPATAANLRACPATACSCRSGSSPRSCRRPNSAPK
jgi:capsular polysaccharide transport system permease protein